MRYNGHVVLLLGFVGLFDFGVVGKSVEDIHICGASENVTTAGVVAFRASLCMTHVDSAHTHSSILNDIRRFGFFFFVKCVAWRVWLLTGSRNGPP